MAGHIEAANDDQVVTKQWQLGIYVMPKTA
jgi:hypothetical protein